MRSPRTIIPRPPSSPSAGDYHLLPDQVSRSTEGMQGWGLPWKRSNRPLCFVRQGIKVIFRNVNASNSENYTYWKLKMENLYPFDFVYKQLLCFSPLGAGLTCPLYGWESGGVLISFSYSPVWCSWSPLWLQSSSLSARCVVTHASNPSTQISESAEL